MMEDIYGGLRGDGWESVHKIVSFCATYLYSWDAVGDEDIAGGIKNSIRIRIGLISKPGSRFSGLKYLGMLENLVQMGSKRASELQAEFENNLSAANDLKGADAHIVELVDSAREIIDKQGKINAAAEKIEKLYMQWQGICERKKKLQEDIEKLKVEVEEYIDSYPEDVEYNRSGLIALSEEVQNNDLGKAKSSMIDQIDANLPEISIDDSELKKCERDFETIKNSLEGFKKKIWDDNRKRIDGCLNAVAQGEPDSAKQSICDRDGKAVQGVPERTAAITVVTLYAYCKDCDEKGEKKVRVSLGDFKKAKYVSEESKAVLIVGDATGVFPYELDVKDGVYFSQNAYEYLIKKKNA